MNFKEYFLLNEEHTLCPDDVQALNADLVVRSSSEISEEYRPKIADYIVAVLNMGSVEPQLVTSMEKLLQDLQRDS